MFKMRNVVAVAFVFVAAAISVAAQDQTRPDLQTAAPDAKAILKQVAETYKNLKSYHFEGRLTTEQVNESMGLRDERKAEELFVNAAIKPGRYRIESKNANFSVTHVSDGKTKWVYAPSINEYAKKAAEAGADNLVLGRDPLASFAAGAVNMLTSVSNIADRVREAKITGEEKLEIGGQKVDCLVIEAYYSAVSTASQSNTHIRKLWIDKARNIILRQIQHNKSKTPWGTTMESKMTHIFTVARMGEQVPETLFAFTPPEGAKEVAELNSPLRAIAMGRPSRLVGKDAIAFALKDPDGNQVDLQTLKGKVALLNFWASWCGPCVAEMPHIEKLHRDFKDQGLVVLGVNSEEAEVARAFVKERGYTFTTLIDEGKEVAAKYEVTGIPQVFIINREGKIKWHALGYGSGREIELRDAVEKVLKGAEPPAPRVDGGVEPITPARKPEARDGAVK